MIVRINSILLARLALAAAALTAHPSSRAAASATDEASSAFQRGAFAEAASKWEQAKAKGNDEVIRQLNLAAAYQALGQQTRAVDILEEAADLAEKLGAPQLIVRAKGQLGAGLTLLRQDERAEALLRESLDRGRKENLSGPTIAAILNDLGNLLVTQQKTDEALGVFQEGAQLAGNSPEKARLLANAAAAAQRAGNNAKAASLNADALNAIDPLAPSHEKGLLLLRAAETDRSLAQADAAKKGEFLLRSHASAQKALEIAEALQDHAAASYALGHMGRLYEADRQLEHALTMTRRAAFAAQQARSPDALYRWQWQTGRLLKAMNRPKEAISAYRAAEETLQSIRHDLALGYGNATVPSTFRESVGPLFFELADLLLSQADQDKAQEQQLLREARETIEQLKAVELEDYFQDDCVNVVRSRQASLDQVDPHSAVMYLIPLPDRTEVLLSLANGLHRSKAQIGSDALVEKVRAFRRNLETRTTYSYLAEAQELYDLLIRPNRELLANNKINTLVFVPDGALQTIPLAALHDGKQFLVEQFAVTVTPGLSLMEPRPIEHKRQQVLVSGLSDSVQGFPSLDFVPEEVQQVGTEYRAETLLNKQFVTAALEQKLGEEQFSIVHIASHGQFDRDARNTFVLTYDGKLTLNKLEAMIRPSQYRGRPVELLVLSACQTAAGDDRAALGLAGVAVKAGARSALASLWFVNDQSTAAFVSELYDQLRQGTSISRAKAVQAAQVKMLADRRYRHPCYWAPYLLIGNWL